MKPLAQTDLDRVRLCLEKVGLGEKIAKLPKGLLQPLLKQLEADGAELSGGELQKLSLARVLYKDAPVLILDEPTSAYDPLSEERLYRLFDELTKDKTVVYISHRLASTRFCDRIIVLDGGRIIEEGGHEELMKADGYYARLFELQAKMYREAAV
jgi:ABC-type multidrug transport system fused ATPase/permease subunit